MIFTNDLPATKLNWKYVYSEIIELLTEVRKFNLTGIINELCDVYTCSMCAIETTINIPMPIFWMRSANGWIKRLSFFEKYLNDIGLEFKVEYLRYGGNYKKYHKRMKVFELALEDQILKKETKCIN